MEAEQEQVEDAQDQAEQAVAEVESPLEPVAEVDLAAVEAILFATDSALSPAKIADVAGMDGGRRAARQAVDTLNEKYEQMGCAFRIESLAGGYQMLTLPEYNDILARLLKVRNESKLSQAALETLAIIAYKQPILRADIEAIRGVSTGEVVRNLMEKGLVKIVGRAEEIGRPMLYGTTRKFLEVFGLTDLKDLPQVESLASGAIAERPKPAPEQPAEQESPPVEEAESQACEPSTQAQVTDETQAPCDEGEVQQSDPE